MKIVTLLFALLLSGSNLYSQLPCGTKLTPQIIALEKANLPTPPLTPTPPPPPANSTIIQCCLDKTLSMTFWVVIDSSGAPNATPADIAAGIANLNTYFAPICLSFYACAINYINDWNYDSLYFPDERDQLLTLYQTANTINVYMVSIIATDPTTTVAGLGALPPGADAIWLTQGSLGGKTFLHETGHFFGLYHTFETQFGNELANGSNGATQGDKISDTPADPGGKDSLCQLEPYTKDANGDWYVPQIGNIMSYYSDGCSCGFTPQQYDRMCEKYLTYRFYLW